MIGVLGNLGRVVGREAMEEIMARIMAGRTTEDIFTREEIARRIGQKSFDLLVDKIKKELRRRDDEKMKTMTKRKR